MYMFAQIHLVAAEKQCAYTNVTHSLANLQDLYTYMPYVLWVYNIAYNYMKKQHLVDLLAATQMQWHIFIILIASCANVIVAPGNLSIISSVGM